MTCNIFDIFEHFVGLAEKIPDFVTPPSSVSRNSIMDQTNFKPEGKLEVSEEQKISETVEKPAPVRKQVTFDLGELGRPNMIRKRY